ncbi:MAG: zinc ribbon domain-containing protein [Planctomycetes bacterium]|nr:zinc ribbon domain-containing protein [Planctomycetota bacterium]
MFLALTGIGIVLAVPTLIGAIIFSCYNSAPIECPICRTRLVGGGEKKPTYESVEQAEGKGFCRSCNTPNAADAAYCSKCGAKLGGAA